MIVKNLVKRVPLIGTLGASFVRRIRWLFLVWRVADYDDVRLLILAKRSPVGIFPGHKPTVGSQPGLPYFGTFLRSQQGDPRRHFFMQKTLEVACDPASDNGFVKMLEIGSWAGGSAITYGQHIKSQYAGRGLIVCVDSWQPYFREIDTNKSGPYEDMSLATDKDRIFNLFLYNMKAAGLSDIVIPIKGLSKEVIPLLGEGFDYAFIDGSHYYEDVIQDLEMVAPLIKDGGVISGDDLEIQLHEYAPGTLPDNRGEDCVNHPVTGQPFHPGVTQAVAEVFGEVSSWEGHWAMQKIAGEWRGIEMSFAPQDVIIPDHLDLPQNLV
jgi:predicted O-methyltransferase YrrM